MSRSRVFLVLQAMLCVALAALLAAGAADIYREGAALRQAGDSLGWIYTREKAAERFMPIAPLLFASIGLTVAGLVLGIRDEKAGRSSRNDEAARDLACAMVQTPSGDMARERRAQRRLRVGGWAAFGLCMLPVMAFVSNGAHFGPAEAVEADFRALMKVIVPWTALGIGCLAVASVLEGRHVRRETEAARTRRAEERASGIAPVSAACGTQAAGGARRVRAMRIALAVIAAAFIAMGILNGGMRDVLVKAINICTECVGLG